MPSCRPDCILLLACQHNGRPRGSLRTVVNVADETSKDCMRAVTAPKSRLYYQLRRSQKSALTGYSTISEPALGNSYEHCERIAHIYELKLSSMAAASCPISVEERPTGSNTWTTTTYARRHTLWTETAAATFEKRAKGEPRIAPDSALSFDSDDCYTSFEEEGAPESAMQVSASWS